MTKNNNSKRQVRQSRVPRRGNGPNRGPQTPLLPVGVNNNATMPKVSQHYVAHGEEVLGVINVTAGSTSGQLVYNQQIGPTSCARLSRLSELWQRIDWDHTVLNIVALNGSLVTAGYNAGFLEDPEIDIPTDPSNVIPFLTALRGTSVRQNWVQSTTGQSVTLSKLPEMYTTLGQDVRRFYIGRLVVALTGDVGAAGASYQILLKYRVALYVPRVVLSVAPIPPVSVTPFVAGALRGPDDDGDTDNFAFSPSAIPAIGRYVLTGGQSVQMVTGTVAESSRLRVVGFEVFGGVGETGDSWGTNTRALINTPDNPVPWASNGTEFGWWYVTSTDASVTVAQELFVATSRFDYIP